MSAISPPPRRLPPDERALVDAFLATRGATRCPPCTFSPAPHPADWRAQMKAGWRGHVERAALAGRVRTMAAAGLHAEAIAGRLGRSESLVRVLAAEFAIALPRKPRDTARRDAARAAIPVARLRELAAAGLTGGAIAAAIGRREKTVRQWLATHDIPLARGISGRPPIVPAERLRALVARGMTRPQIAAATGLTLGAVHKRLAHLGLCVRDARKR